MIFLFQLDYALVLVVVNLAVVGDEVKLEFDRAAFMNCKVTEKHFKIGILMLMNISFIVTNTGNGNGA